MHQRAPTGSRTWTERLAEWFVENLGPGEKCRAPSLRCGNGALSLACRNEKAASDPSHFRRVAPSLLKQTCANTGTRQFVEPWDHTRWERGPQLTHNWPWTAHVRFHATRTLQRCARLTLPTPSANCTERKSLVHWKLTHLSCCLIFASAWHETGSVLWTREPSDAEESRKNHRCQRFCLPLRLESSAKDCVSTKHRIWPALMTSLCGRESRASSARCGESLTTALSEAGLEMNPSKCAACRPHDPFNSEFVVDTGLVVLGSPAVDGGEMPLGAPMWDESNLANDPTTGSGDTVFGQRNH